MTYSLSGNYTHLCGTIKNLHLSKDYIYVFRMILTIQITFLNAIH